MHVNVIVEKAPEPSHPWCRLSRTLLVFTLASLLLAGCFAGGTKTDAGDLAARPGRGILAGVVVDDAVRLVAGAHVNVTATGVALNATTDVDGLFRFPDLAPGAYVVEARKAFYAAHKQAVVVLADVPDPAIVRFQLVFEPSSVPYATVYKHEGYHECGADAGGPGAIRVCSNVNIATWIVLCAQTEGAVCLGNVTNDRSVFFQDIPGPPTFIQAELSWEATSAAGTDLSFLIGGGTEEELKAGVALPAYNATNGPSPLMVRVSNHEGPNAWCNTVPDPPCGERAIEDSKLGVERVLLGQVDAGTSAKTPVCGTVSPCGTGWSMLQQFTLYTTVFYGYEPPMDWLFTETGKTPDPPA